MAAKVYSLSKEVPAPNFSVKDWQKADEKYINDVEAYIRKLGYNDAFTGKQIHFQAGDGYAVYMVATIKPLVLIHIEVGDAWHFQYAHLLNATEVKKKIKQQEEMKKLFSRK